jgi:hypothetical protein
MSSTQDIAVSVSQWIDSRTSEDVRQLPLRTKDRHLELFSNYFVDKSEDCDAHHDLIIYDLPPLMRQNQNVFGQNKIREDLLRIVEEEASKGAGVVDWSVVASRLTELHGKAADFDARLCYMQYRNVECKKISRLNWTTEEDRYG